MNNASVAFRYARALFDVATAEAQLPEVVDDMAAVARILRELPQVREFCLEESRSRGTEHLLIETAFVPYVERFTANMLRAVAENGRLAAVPFIPEAFLAVREEASQTVAVLLETACEAEEALVVEVTERMKARTGRNVNVTCSVVPALLGGFRVTWDDREIDLSAAGRIRKLRMLLASA